MKRKVMATLVAAGMAVAVTACGGSGTTSTTDTSVDAAQEEDAADVAADVAADAKDANGEYKVAFLCKSYTDTFCLNVKEEFEKAAADYADLFAVDYFDSENTAATQNDQIETCTAAGYDAIVFQQVDAEAPVEVVKAALDKGIYVVVTTGHIEDGGASWYVDADPYQQGQVVADYAVEQGYCDNAKVAILSGPTGNFHSENRVQAFKDAIDAKDDATLVATEVADWSKDTAMTVTQNWLVAYPDLKVILAANDDMGLGAVEAIEMAGLSDQVKVFAIDGTEGGLQAVKDGRLGATVMQDTKGYAVEALNITSELLKGETAESMNIDSTLITADNVDEYLK